MKKKLIAFLTASTMLFTMSISAYAAQYEFTHKNGTKTTPGEVIAQGKAGEILAQKQDYKIELKDGKQYNLADYLVALKDNPTFTEDQIIEKLNENAAEELKVVSVSAISETSVEVVFNKKVEALTAEDFTLTPALKVTAAQFKSGSDDKAVLLTTLRQETGQAYQLSYKGKETGKTFSGFAVIDKVSFVTADFNKQIGSDFVLVAKVEDQSGKGIAGQPVKLQASGEYSAFEEKIEKEGVTDEQGQVSFTWTRSNEGLDHFTVIAKNKPIARKDGVVVWTLANPYLTIDEQAMKNETLSDESAFEFSITAKDEKNADFEGDLILDFDIKVESGKTASIQESGQNNIKVQVWHNEKWTDMAGGATGLYEVSDKQAKYKMTKADKGAKKFRVYTQDDTNLAASVESIVVTTWYDLEKDGGSMGKTDPRVVTGEKSYVAAKPVVELQAKDEKTVIATSEVTDSDTHYKEYTLTVKDQFGKPFHGNVILGAYKSSDANVMTSDEGTWTYALSEAQNGIYAAPVTVLNAGAQTAPNTRTIDTRIDKTIKANNSMADIRLLSSVKGNMELIAIVDRDNAPGEALDVEGVLDANDVYNTNKVAVESQDRAAATFEASEMNEGNPAAGGLKVWKVESKDQFGAPIQAVNDISVHLFDEDMSPVDTPNGLGTGNGPDVYIDLDGSTKGKLTAAWSGEDNTGAVNSTPAVLNDKNVTKSPFYVAMDGGAADTKYNIRLWADHASGTPDVYDQGEAMTLFSATFAAQKLSSGEWAAIAAENFGDVSTVTVAGNKSFAFLSDYDAKDGAVKFSYALKDQSGQALNTTGKAGIPVTWTISNKGDNEVTVKASSGDVTLEKGATGTYTTISDVATASKAELIIVGKKETDLEIKVIATGEPEGAEGATTKLFFTKNVLAANNGKKSGKVVAFSHTIPEAGDDSGHIVLQTVVGYVIIPHDLGTQTYAVDGNTATEEQFKKVIAIGDTLSVDASGANAAFELTK